MTTTAPLIYKKMSEVMEEIGVIGKDQKNTSQGFKFRGIDQFVNTLYPALLKAKVFMAPRCVQETHEIKEVVRSSGKTGLDKFVSIQMEYDFFAEDGSKVTVGPIPAEGLDSGDKATNKALSAALKYALIQTFSVPTADMEEGDATSPEISKPVETTVKAATIFKPTGK
jgi:ERF superfamily